MSKKWTETKTFKRLQKEDSFFDYDEEDYAGIYKITNITNGKVYIGQSRDTLYRIRSHRKDLKGNYHPNRHLQAAWNKYGEDNFIFETITSCGFKDLTKFEIFWIEIYDSCNRDSGYNIMTPNENGDGFTLSKESRKILSDKMKIRMERFSDEELLSFLHEFYYQENRVPTRADLIATKGYPSNGTYWIRFGSLKNALIEAGLYEYVDNKKLFERGNLTREDIIENYKSFVEKHGRFPTSKEQKYTSESGLYPTSSVVSVFGGIQDLKDILGFTKEKEIREENELSLIALKKLYDEKGNLNRTIIDKSPITRSTSFYSKRFGSLNTAYKLAGIEFDSNRLAIPIVQLTKEGDYIRDWKSSTEAMKETGINSINILHSLKGRNPSAGGYKWVYKEEYEKDEIL